MNKRKISVNNKVCKCATENDVKPEEKTVEDYLHEH